MTTQYPLGDEKGNRLPASFPDVLAGRGLKYVGSLAPVHHEPGSRGAHRHRRQIDIGLTLIHLKRYRQRLLVEM
jgi:hypothetical protein